MNFEEALCFLGGFLLLTLGTKLPGAPSLAAAEQVLLPLLNWSRALQRRISGGPISLWIMAKTIRVERARPSVCLRFNPVLPPDIVGLGHYSWHQRRHGHSWM